MEEDWYSVYTLKVIILCLFKVTVGGGDWTAIY